jgi:hypothetical protein
MTALPHEAPGPTRIPRLGCGADVALSSARLEGRVDRQTLKDALVR